MTLILSGTDGLSDVDGSAATPAIRGTDANTGIFFPAADTIGFAEGGAEIARFDSSGNLGIGTSSPSYKLDVNGSIRGDTFVRATGGSVSSYLVANSAGSFGVVGTASNHPLLFNTNDTERMRIDTSGNVGIGTSSPAQKLDVIGGARSYSRIANGGTSNTGASTTWWYIGTIFLIDSQSATLRMDGGIGYGPSEKSSGATYLYLRKDNSTGLIGYFSGTTFGSNGIIAIAYKATATPYQFDLWIRIAEYGSASVYCDTVGTYVPASTDTGTATQPAGSTLFTSVWTATTAGIERARIDSLGSLLINTTSNGYGVTGGIYAPSVYGFTTASAANMHIENGGFMRRSTSSLKYKTDVQDATHGLAKVMQLRAVTYKGINDGDKVFGGLIAEEVHEAGLTEFVQYAEDGSPDALAYGNMVSLCIKAIQELKALVDTQASTITQLQADVASLQAPQGTP